MAGQFARLLPLRWAAIFTLFCHLNGRHSGQTGRNLFVSLYGKDSKMCGSPDMPCRTIGRAVQQVVWGDTIYLDGSGTEQQPYNCPITIPATYEIPGIHVTKSLTIIGFSSEAHVSCTSGVFFTESTGREIMLVKLSNIEFRATAVVFRNCSAQIEDCTFRDTLESSAIGFKAGNISRNVSLVITNASFTNNSLCVAADLSDNVSELNVLIDVQNTRFQGNGLVTSPSGTGGILLSNSSKSEGVMQVRVRCSNVSYVDNQGSFMTLDLVTAITNESYVNMTVMRNRINRISYSRTEQVWQSLYCSRARKSNVNFTAIRCKNNSNVRCVGTSTDQLSLGIRDSLFSEQHLKAGKGGALLIAQPEKLVHITLKNTSFVRNTAKEGGCVYVENGKGTVHLNIFAVSFNQCVAERQGSALTMGSQGKTLDPTRGTKELFANFKNVSVLNCTVPLSASDSSCGAVCLIFRADGIIEFDHVVWLGNIARTFAALLVGNVQGLARIYIHESSIIENLSSPNSILCITSLVPATGVITISNTKIDRSSSVALSLDPLFKSNLYNVTVTSSKYAALLIREPARVWHKPPPRLSKNVTVNISNCLFEDNTVSVICTLQYSSGKVVFTLMNSTLRGLLNPPKSQYQALKGAYTFIFSIRSSKKQNPSETVINIENTTFDSATSSMFSLKFKGNKTLRIIRSKFKNCTVLCKDGDGSCKSTKLQYGGAVTIFSGSDLRKLDGCIPRKPHRNTHPTWTYDSHILFEDTSFERNEGMYAGAVYLVNGSSTFRRCTFENNFVLHRGGHVTVAPNSGQVEFISNKFNQTTAKRRPSSRFIKLLYSESLGKINIVNTSMIYDTSNSKSQQVLEVVQGGYVYVDLNSHILCSVSKELTFENLTHLTSLYYRGNRCRLNLTAFRFYCGLCTAGRYSLQRGNTSGLFVQQGFQCLPCPYGADCIRNIIAKPDFWGYLVSTHPPSLNFISCPEGYCSPPADPDPSIYNGCHGNRTGVLCGSCRYGYTETLFSTECRPIEKCSKIWFWIWSAILLLCFTLFLVRKPPVFAFLHRQIFWFRESSERQAFEEDLGPSQHSNSSYFKITFYFYQVADLLFVGSLIEVARRVPFVLPVVGLFKLQIQSFDEGIGCPFAGLTAVTKELFMSLGPFGVLTCVFAIYSAHRLISLIRRQNRPNFIQYLAVALETLLLGYERLAETALKLLHCIPLGSDWRLFYDGNIVCWQWWQTVILLYILVFLVPFIGVLYWGSLLLHAKCISFREFLGACALPVPFLIRWAVFHLTGRLKSQILDDCDGKEVLEVLHGPFRAPSNQDAGSLYWESVLIGRRFILLSLSAFVVDPMMRLACMTSACVLMAFHHVIKRPYRELTANRVETASLLLLVLLGVVNLARASFQSAGTDPGGPTVAYFVAFRWLEVTCLALAPCLVVLLAIFAVLSQFLRLIIFLCSRIAPLFRVMGLLRENGNDERKPLVSPTEYDNERDS